ncbi:MAG: DUF975 family protein [Lachnospiraceae bacterium]|nr:DUF975 family protein [Lachnospiraceae bacterium]
MEQTSEQTSEQTAKCSEQTLLSRAQLKDHAKNALEGNYKIMVPVMFLTGLMTLAIQLATEFLASFLFSLIVVGSNLATSGLSADQMTALLQTTSYLEEYAVFYTVIDYFIQALVSVFTSVFHVGATLLCLNIACGNPIQMQDIFYGFRVQFRKSLSISAAFVAVSQLYLIPLQLLQHEVQSSTDITRILTMLCLLLLGIAIYLPLYLAISQAYLLLLDFPDRRGKDLLKLSVHLMRGHKLRLFSLQLSFLPLMLLAFFSMGIGNLWLTPYMDVAYAFFFLNLMRSRA